MGFYKIKIRCDDEWITTSEWVGRGGEGGSTDIKMVSVVVSLLISDDTGFLLLITLSYTSPPWPNTINLFNL